MKSLFWIVFTVLLLSPFEGPSKKVIQTNIKVIPMPQEIITSKGTFVLTNKTSIKADPKLITKAEQLRDYLQLQVIYFQ